MSMSKLPQAQCTNVSPYAKNAVQRLQKLENDIKTVISIYEVAKKSGVKNDDTEEENETSPPLTASNKLSKEEKTKWGVTKKPTSVSDQYKKLVSPRFGTRTHFAPGKKDPVAKKPSSAPSSSSTTTTTRCESEYLWQPTSDSNNAKWTDFLDSSSTLLTISENFQSSKEILPKNDFQIITEVDDSTDDNASKRQVTKKKDGDFKDSRKVDTNTNDNAKEVMKKLTEKLPKGEKSSKPSSPTNYITALIEKELAAKHSKLLSDNSETPHVLIPKKVPRLVKQRLESFEKQNKDKSFGCRKLSPERGKNESKTAEGKSSKRCTSRESYEREKNKSKTEQKKNARTVYPLLNSLSAGKIQKHENEKLSAIELFKIIEKSNEKLEKMQMSKVLALDIAAQLKEKHEEIKRSKQDMMEKLQLLEKDNERLNSEIKSAREKKKKLQMKMEGFCSYSKTKLLKQDLRSREILEENEQLKTKLQEIEKKYNEEYIDKLVEIDKTQKDRLQEIKSELKNRETRAEEEIKKLIHEKSNLAEEVDELHCCLHERQMTVENLESKISDLEEEIKKQKHYLKKKTERLEESHKELEAIRENCQVLEEQVKTLRTHIENFDDMQKNLMKGISDRESQIKSSQTEIKKLQQENATLRGEMEKEKDSVLIKTKIIEDQQETIKQMREKLEEAKSLLRKNQSLERLLDREREEKLELQEALECVKTKKEELKKKIKSLEADLLIAPEEVVKDLQKTQMVLHELENQVHIKQKEWEHHLQLLIKEKEQACSVAEFATKKLMQTTNKFQKQSEAHKKLHQMLAENLAEKEKYLRETLSKGSYIQMKPMGSYVRPEMKRSSEELCLHNCTSGEENVIATEMDWKSKKMFAVDRIGPKESTYFF